MYSSEKKYLSYLLAAGVILALLLIMFYPALEGKTIFQEDVLSWKANAKEALDFIRKRANKPIGLTTSLAECLLIR